MKRIDFRHCPDKLFPKDEYGIVEYSMHNAKLGLLDYLKDFVKPDVKLADTDKKQPIEVIYSDFEPLFKIYVSVAYDIDYAQKFLYEVYQGDPHLGPIVCDRCQNSLRNSDYIEYSEEWQSIKCNHCLADLKKEIKDSSNYKPLATITDLLNFSISGNTITVDSNEIKKEKEGNKKENAKIALKSPKDIYSYLDKYVKGQDEAKKLMSVVGSKHLRIINNPNLKIEKSNCFITGTSGSGKTHMSKVLAEYLNVPCVVFDMTSVSAEGYVGGSMKDAIQQLLNKAKGNIELAEKGIICLDEAQKIASVKGQGRQINKDDIQERLLGMLEGIDVEVKDSRDNKVTVNTKNILFIATGAFHEITHRQYKEKNNKSIGFLENKPTAKKHHIITSDNIINQGILPEVMGRFTHVINLKPLSKKVMKEIILDTENSALKQMQDYFKEDNKELEITDKAVDKIVEELFNNSQLGARGIKTLLEGLLSNTIFEVMGNEQTSITTITVRAGKYKIITKEK